MNKNLQIVRLKDHTPEWIAFRQSGIGGSEVGTVLGINRYDTAVRLFHEKIGTIQPRQIDSESMFWGRIMEENIANAWSFYDGSKDGYLENYAAGKIVRKCRNLNGYVVNPEYPWLFGSIDRLINKDGGFNLITGEPLQNEAILECKNLSFWMEKVWEDGIPIYNLAQVHQYMAILDVDYAEIARLIGGNNLSVVKVQRDEQLVQRIIEITKSFWYDRVIPAREAKEKRDAADLAGNFAEAERWDARIQQLEPDPDGSDAYKEFMEEKFVVERETVTGTMELYKLAKKDNFLRKLINRADKDRDLIKNIFVKYLVQSSSEAIDFGKLGYVNWSTRKGSASRTFNNKTKDKPTDEQVEEVYDKIDIDF